jgi:hypothetical protein
MAVAEAIAVLEALKQMADAARELKELYDEDGELDEKLDQIIKGLQGLRLELVRGINEILEAIGEVAHTIDEDVAFDNMSLADRALYSDLGIFGDKEAAMGNSFQAANRLLREADVVFATAFMYVVNIRLAIVKDFDPNFPCRPQFREEIQAYIDHLNGWITQLNDLITRLHSVVVERVSEVIDDEDGRPRVVLRYWMAQHIRDGVVVRTFIGDVGDLSSATRSRVERQARDSRTTGVAADRQSLGVVSMEGVAQVWAQSLGIGLRLALVTQVLNRPVRAIDFNSDGLMVDGRIIPTDLDLRTTLIEVLTSTEFRGRFKRTWEAFLERGNSEFVQLAHRRLFQRDATDEESELLRDIARRYGYGAFVAALLYSDEYEQRFGRGLPGGDRPLEAETELELQR